MVSHHQNMHLHPTLLFPQYHHTSFRQLKKTFPAMAQLSPLGGVGKVFVAAAGVGSNHYSPQGVGGQCARPVQHTLKGRERIVLGSQNRVHQLHLVLFS